MNTNAQLSTAIQAVLAVPHLGESIRYQGKTMVDAFKASVTLKNPSANDIANFKSIACSVETQTARDLIDTFFMAICGWSFDSLNKLADRDETTWLAMLLSEIEDDVADPFENTKELLADWIQATNDTPDECRRVNVLFGNTFGQSVDQLLELVVNDLNRRLSSVN